MNKAVLAGLAAVALFGSAAAPAYAAVQSYYPNADVSAGAYTLSLPSGSSLVFDSNLSGFDSSLGVATTGSAQVFTAFGVPATFQIFGNTDFPNDQLGSFSVLPSSTAIPFSIALGTLGFEFQEADGEHYGLAAYGGTQISSYFLATEAGENINLSIPYAPVSSAPEPGAWGLMLAGLAMIGAVLRLGRRRRAAAPQVA